MCLEHKPVLQELPWKCPSPGSYTDRVAIEVTALGETQGTEFLVFPGTRERRCIGAVQPRTETIKPRRCPCVRHKQGSALYQQVLPSS